MVVFSRQRPSSSARKLETQTISPNASIAATARIVIFQIFGKASELKLSQTKWNVKRALN